jgi:hypothetical protein
MFLKGFDSHATVCRKRKERCRDSLDLSAQLLPLKN